MQPNSKDALFTSTVLPYLDNAYDLARWLVGNSTDAEDVVQDACIRALGALERTRVENPKAWLLTIVRNSAFTWMQKNRPRSMISLSDDDMFDEAMRKLAAQDPSAEETMIVAAQNRSLEAAILALPVTFRETLIMREIHGLSYLEISIATGAPVGTVMSRLARARAILAQTMRSEQ